MQDEIWNQFGIQNYNGNVLSVYSVDYSFVYKYNSNPKVKGSSAAQKKKTLWNIVKKS